MFRKKTLLYFRDQYEFVNSKNKPCHEGNDSDHFINCYRENYFNELKQKNHQCFSFYEFNIMNKQYPNIPICQNASENTEVREILTNLSLTYGKKFFTPDDKDLLCKMPCSLEDISMHPKIIKHSGKSKPKNLVKLIHSGSFLAMIFLKFQPTSTTDNLQTKNNFIMIFSDTSDSYHVVYIALSRNLKVLNKEYFMYDLVSIVSSIGGGIGIFLGYSCFGLFLSGIKDLYDKINNRNKT